MKRALYLAVSLARIPRLFAHLLLWPLLISLCLVYAQIIVTGAFLGAVRDGSGENTDDASPPEYQQQALRYVLYGSKEPLPEYKVCRWAATASGKEVPPNKDCMPSRLDAAIKASDPANFNFASFQSNLNLNGSIERLHICRSCRPDLVFDASGPKVETHIYSIWGAALLALLEMHQDIIKTYSEASIAKKKVSGLIGEIFLHAKGFRGAVNTRQISVTAAILMNIAMLIILSLWLAIRAHRKILDYFSKSGALLPLAASMGKGSFYGAVWFLTFFRVAAFLLASVPLTIQALRSFLDQGDFDGFFKGDASAVSIWVLGILISFFLAAMLSSIAELKSRHGVLSLLYRYLPLLVCGLGSLLWAISFLQETSAAGTFRAVITGLPLVGMGPLLVSPIFPPPYEAIAANTLLTLLFALWIIRNNAKWFAAHLEEL